MKNLQCKGKSVSFNLDFIFCIIGLREPKVCITTSRDPSSRLKQFAKEIKLCIPNSQSINRGICLCKCVFQFVFIHADFSISIYVFEVRYSMYLPMLGELIFRVR